MNKKNYLSLGLSVLISCILSASAVYAERSQACQDDALTHASETDLNKAVWDAVVSGDVACLKKVIRCGADVNKASNTIGDTPLRMAVSRDNFEVVQLLIDAGADVHKANHVKNTPLHTAALYGYSEIAQVLINAGANINIPNEAGNTSFDLAVIRDHLEIVQSMINAGVDFNVYNSTGLERLLEVLITREFGDSAWTPIIEFVEARTGVRREDIAARAKAATRRWQLVQVLQTEGPEAAKALIADTTLVGIVTISGLMYDNIARVGEIMMSKNSDLLVVYATEDLVDQLGVDAFSGFIFPGSGDNYPWHKTIFTLVDMPESDRTQTERLYQKVYSLAKQYSIPTFGICAGAQHLVLNREGALMKSKNRSSTITLQPFTPIHYMSLSDEEQQKTLEQCQTPEITMDVFRAHTYSAEPNHLGDNVTLASIDGETPMAFYEKFRAFGTQFHPEARYAEVSIYGDTNSQLRQTQLLNSFIELCKQHNSFIQQAQSAGQTREDAIVQRDAFYRKILERLKECAQQQYGDG